MTSQNKTAMTEEGRQAGKNNPRWRHGMANSPFWLSWERMKGRCLNPDDRAFKNYGGRGIKVCERWMTFENFRDDMLPTYFERATIERLNVDGDYEPTNCKWIPRSEQNDNKRNTHWVTHNGKTQTISKWAKELGRPYITIYRRLRVLGYTPEEALTPDLLPYHPSK